MPIFLENEERMRLLTAIRRFDRQIQADGRSSHTRHAYMRDLHYLSEYVGRETDVRAIRAPALVRYFSTSTGGTEGSAPIRGNRPKCAVRAFFRFLEEAGHIRENPARLIKNHRSDPKPPEHLSPAEVRSFLATLKGTRNPTTRRDRVMFSLLLGTGMRLGSLVELIVGDVDLKGRYVSITAKGEVERKAYFNSSLSRRLRTYIKAAGLSPEDPLFPSRNGGHLSTRQVQLRFKHWLKAAGIDPKYSVHSLRHTFAMNLYLKTGDLRLVQTALGHKRITTTEIYARVDGRRLKRALEKL
jgi:integrase/recombinase XerC